MRRFLLLSFLLASLFFVSPIFAEEPSVVCENSEQCQQKINEFTQKLNELGKAKNTLANQIKIIDSQVQLTLLKITQTQSSIKTLEKEIDELTIKIGNLDVSLNQLTAVYISQIAQNYKLQKKLLPLSGLFLNNSFNSFLEQYKYISVLQKSSHNTIISMETVRTNYDIQKEEKNKKQIELEDLKKKLASQQVSLDKQRKSKNTLLEATKNDEKEYQKKLAEAQSQLASLKRFASGAGGYTCIAPNQPTGSDNNFYSQRDGRWCSQIINNSNDQSDTIGRIGCAISSYAIVQKKKGSDILPSSIAADPSNFDLYSKVLINKLRNNYHKGYSSSIIDSELRSGHYVIAELSAFGGTHFVVIISGSNGNYIIHDPWYGPDQKLNDHYSTGLIISLRLMW